MKIKLFFLIFAIAAIAIISCDSWMTGTFTITYDVDDIATSDADVDQSTIDLSDNEDYEDHREHIESIDQISVIGWIKNRSSNSVSGEIWVDADDNLVTLDDVRNNATLVFSPPSALLGGNDSMFINWQEGLESMQNVDTLRNYIQNLGYFTVYALADETPFEIEMDVEIVITFTAGY